MWFLVFEAIIIITMPKLHTHNLSLGATAAKLYVSMGVALKEEQIVA
jgi:hypothetical protein